MKTREDQLKELANDILVTACEGGVNYWARVYSYCPDLEETHTWIEDREEGKKYYIDSDTILRKVKKMLEDTNLDIAESIIKNIRYAYLRPEESNLDANDCDCILQYICFGAVIYG